MTIVKHADYIRLIRDRLINVYHEPNKEILDKLEEIAHDLEYIDIENKEMQKGLTKLENKLSRLKEML